MIPYNINVKLGDGYDVRENQPRSSPFNTAIFNLEKNLFSGASSAKIHSQLITSSEDTAASSSKSGSVSARGSGWGFSAKASASFSYNSNINRKKNEVIY